MDRPIITYVIAALLELDSANDERHQRRQRADSAEEKFNWCAVTPTCIFHKIHKGFPMQLAPALFKEVGFVSFRTALLEKSLLRIPGQR